jgi:hypothetical protein
MNGIVWMCGCIFPVYLSIQLLNSDSVESHKCGVCAPTAEKLFLYPPQSLQTMSTLCVRSIGL